MSFEITLADIQEVLSDLCINYKVYGEKYVYTDFCSFRNPQDRGVYFAVGKINPPLNVSKSLFICDQKRLDLLEQQNTLIVVDDAQSTFYLLLQQFFPQQTLAGIHPTALINPKAMIAENVEIGPYCIIGDARIKQGTILRPHIVVYDKSEIGEGVTIESQCVIGATGVAWTLNPANGKRIIQPQLGGVKIGRNTFIGANGTIVRGSLNEYTKIGNDCVIAPGCKIGHGCRIGAFTHFGNNVTIAGNVDIGESCFLGSGSVVRPQVFLAPGTIVGAGAVIVKNVTVPNQILIGVPAKPTKETKKKYHGVPMLNISGDKDE